jgi:hypothetical protein
VYAGQFIQQSWTETQAYTNVTISVFLSSFTPDVAFHLSGFLTTDTGPSASPPALATTSFTGVTASASSPQSFLLFSGLSLGPGTYYLTLSGTDIGGPTPGALWLGAGPPPPIVLDTGVGLPNLGICTSGACTPNATYPVASAFAQGADVENLTVTAVPEPLTVTATLAALGCHVIVGLKRRIPPRQG